MGLWRLRWVENSSFRGAELLSAGVLRMLNSGPCGIGSRPVCICNTNGFDVVPLGPCRLRKFISRKMVLQGTASAAQNSRDQSLSLRQPIRRVQTAVAGVGQGHDGYLNQHPGNRVCRCFRPGQRRKALLQASGELMRACFCIVWPVQADKACQTAGLAAPHRIAAWRQAGRRLFGSGFAFVQLCSCRQLMPLPGQVHTP